MTVTATQIQREMADWRQAETFAITIIKEAKGSDCFLAHGQSLESWTTLSEMEKSMLLAGRRTREAEEAALKLLKMKTPNRTLDTSPAAVAAARQQFDFGTI